MLKVNIFWTSHAELHVVRNNSQIIDSGTLLHCNYIVKMAQKHIACYKLLIV